MRGFVQLTIACVTAIALLTVPSSAPAKGHVRLTVRAVSNPPAKVPARLHLHVSGSAQAVTVYASPAPRVMKGAVRLGRSSVRRHWVAVKVPRRLQPGAWFIVLCPGNGRRRCAASRKPMLKLPKTLSSPVQASPAPEASVAATATIGSAGGTLNATAADGTRFALTIAAGSVSDGTQITMTPLASLGGPRWAGKLIGAVQLAPEGLVLVHGGTLTITPARAVPVSRQIGIGYDGAGSDLREVPLAPTRSAIQIPLAHFSGAGLGDSPGGATPPSGGSTTMDFYGQLIAEAIQQARDGEISEDQASAEMLGWLQDALADVMREEVPPGLSDDDAAHRAISDLLTIARDAQLVTGGHYQSLLDAATPAIHKLMEGIYNRAQQRCANNHDLSQIAKIVDTDRTERLFGFQGHQFSQDVQCLKFKVEIDSQVNYDPSKVDPDVSGGFQWHYQASVPIQADVSNGQPQIHGSGPGSFASATGSTTSSGGSFCNGTQGTSTATETLTSANGNTVTVPDFHYQLSGQDISGITLTLNSSASEAYHEAQTGQCPSTGDVTESRWWGDVFDTAVLNGNATMDSDGNSIVIPLDRASGDVIAQISIPASDGGGYSGFTSIQIIHDPPPAP